MTDAQIKLVNFLTTACDALVEAGIWYPPREDAPYYRWESCGDEIEGVTFNPIEALKKEFK